MRKQANVRMSAAHPRMRRRHVAYGESIIREENHLILVRNDDLQRRSGTSALLQRAAAASHAETQTKRKPGGGSAPRFAKRMPFRRRRGSLAFYEQEEVLHAR